MTCLPSLRYVVSMVLPSSVGQVQCYGQTDRRAGPTNWPTNRQTCAKQIPSIPWTESLSTQFPITLDNFFSNLQNSEFKKSKKIDYRWEMKCININVYWKTEK